MSAIAISHQLPPRPTGGQDPDELVVTLAALPMHHPSRPAVRRQAIEAWLPLATHVAHRFTGKGEPLADLVQTATVGLIKAVDRFDPAYGNGFVAFAVPTVSGELKRYFRDQTWVVHMPRHLQELRLAIVRCRESLAQQLGHLPSPAELATAMHVPVSQVREGLRASYAYSTTSLDTPTRDPSDGGASPLGEMLGQEDRALATVEFRVAAGPALAALSERDRRILHLRYYAGLSQEQIAKRIGISQMHVSRLLTRMLATLRNQLADEAG